MIVESTLFAHIVHLYRGDWWASQLIVIVADLWNIYMNILLITRQTRYKHKVKFRSKTNLMNLPRASFTLSECKIS